MDFSGDLFQQPDGLHAAGECQTYRRRWGEAQSSKVGVQIPLFRNMARIVLNMTGFVLNMHGFFTNRTGLVLNISGFVL